MRMIWTDQEVERLRRMFAEDLPLSLMAKTFGRSEQAVDRKARYLGLERGAALTEPEETSLPARVVLQPGRLDQCTWLYGEKPHWTYCKEKVWNGTAWCKEHWHTTHFGRWRVEDAA